MSETQLASPLVSNVDTVSGKGRPKDGRRNDATHMNAIDSHSSSGFLLLLMALPAVYASLTLGAAGTLCAGASMGADRGAECSKTVNRRIEFENGSRFTEVEGEVSADSPQTWIVGAKAGQLLLVELLEAESSVSLSIESPMARDGTSILLATKTRQWGGRLTVSGDYVIQVSADVPLARYRLKVTLSASKTPVP